MFELYRMPLVTALRGIVARGLRSGILDASIEGWRSEMLNATITLKRFGVAFLVLSGTLMLQSCFFGGDNSHWHHHHNDYSHQEPYRR
jgi:hypothetical protein